MVRNKIFEWIGFVIVLISVAVNGTLRAKGITTGTEINLTIIGIIVGLVLTFSPSSLSGNLELKRHLEIVNSTCYQVFH